MDRKNKDKDKVILWIDLTESGGATLLPGVVAGQCRIRHIRDTEKIGPEIRSAGPSLVCFEYDYPNNEGLTALAETKRDYPALPIVLITTYHSEALAVWALRARVWDYIVKPYSIDDVLRTLNLLSKVCRQQSRRPRAVIAPVKESMYAPPFSRLTGKERAILKAKSYIEAHLGKKLHQADIAGQCGMSLSHFSRAFRQINGVGFSEFLLRARINRALHLLEDVNAQITSICYEVGFRDLSYFGRIFRRYVGISPSEYRDTQIKLTGADNDAHKPVKYKLDTGQVPGATNSDETNSGATNEGRKRIGLFGANDYQPVARQPLLVANDFGLMSRGPLSCA